MPFSYILAALIVLIPITSAFGQEEQKVPDHIYPDLEYALSLSKSTTDLEPEKLSTLINFISTRPAETSMKLKERQGASGAFYAFSIKAGLTRVLDYAYNPDIPLYVTMPSSLREHEWLTPQVNDALRNLPRKVDSVDDIRLLRGRDRETITPDTNTGGYYEYDQDRMVTIFPGPTGPVLISVSSQEDLSEVGKKGCVVGDDSNWNYLYSGEKGLNTTGLGWVSSYMYHAHSVLIYVVDSSANTIRVGSFKWLNAGWAKMNMVKSSHILNGIIRFASDFKEVLESPGLPDALVLENKYKGLLQRNEQDLRKTVSQYLQALKDSGASELRSNPFKKLISSGKYLEQMDKEELVKVVLLEYVKENIGKKSLISLASQSKEKPTSTSLN
ncbi:MAG: hypothetical protein WBB23_12270 [Desulforhopalus sp.]